VPPGAGFGPSDVPQPATQLRELPILKPPQQRIFASAGGTWAVAARIRSHREKIGK